MKLTNFDIAIVVQVLKSPGSNNTVADLRMNRATVETLQSVKMETPPMPELPSKAGATDEQKRDFVTALRVWTEKVKILADQEVEVDLTDVQLAFVREKVTNFRGFQAQDESVRDRLLALAGKLGI